jgi:hypothetical protein
MTGPAVRQYYNRLFFSIGMRKERKRRHDFSVHGFRKFFKTKAKIGEFKAEVEQVKERGSMNEDAIATLSDQVMKLMAEVHQLKQRS